MKNWYKKQKDVSPKETISKIRSILENLGIFTYERFWFNIIEDIYSVRIMTSNLGGIGTNGKGITIELALASAYAEFMERLQNFALVQKNYGLMREFKIEEPDLKFLKKKDINKKIINSIGGNRTPNNIVNEDKMRCLPFYHVNKDKIEYIPDNINSFITSNGFCAGNSAPEAITQGLCEILERYSAIAIYEQDLDIPTIPLEDIKELSVFKYSLELKKKGYDLIVKDCTLDGFIPVLAVVIFNKDHSKCIVNFGSDLNFEVALMRCFTEAYQGIISFNDENRYMAINYSQYKTNPLPIRRSKEDYYALKILDKLLVSATKPNYEGAFQREFINNNESLKFLSNKLIERKYDIYIRDVSFLGFPSYFVYVPGLSEGYSIEEVNVFHQLYVKTPPVILTLPTATQDMIQQYTKAIEEALKNEYFYLSYGFEDNEKFIRDSSKGVQLKANSDLYSLNLQYLLSILYYKLEDYEKAMYYLDLYLTDLKTRGRDLANTKYYKCAVYYHRLRAQKKPINVIKSTMKEIFGESVSNEVLADLSDPDSIFQYLKLPNCGNCSNCDVQTECCYNDWKQIAEILQENINNNLPDQMKLSENFTF